MPSRVSTRVPAWMGSAHATRFAYVLTTRSMVIVWASLRRGTRTTKEARERRVAGAVDGHGSPVSAVGDLDGGRVAGCRGRHGDRTDLALRMGERGPWERVSAHLHGGDVRAAHRRVERRDGERRRRQPHQRERGGARLEHRLPVYTSVVEATIAPVSSFVRARLGSMLAVLPLGVWTIAHVWNNLAAFSGAEAWERSVTTYEHPLAQLVTGVVVLVPLVLHDRVGRRAPAHLEAEQPSLRHVREPEVRAPAPLGRVRPALQRRPPVAGDAPPALRRGASGAVRRHRPRDANPHADARRLPPRHAGNRLPPRQRARHVRHELGHRHEQAGSAPHANVVAWLTFLGFLFMAWAVIYALYRSGG